MQISKMVGQTVVKSKTWESDLSSSAYLHNFEVLVWSVGQAWCPERAFEESSKTLKAKPLVALSMRFYEYPPDD